MRLAEHRYWHKLLHYRLTKEQPAGVISDINSPDFFLSKDGNLNPTSELEATISAFMEPAGDDKNTHAQCRFPARFKWLRNTLKWDEDRITTLVCDNYNTWTHQNSVGSLSLVFATGYLSNPASYYGHILLKFNTDRSMLSTALLDESLNFGAIIPNDENGLVYVIKGLFGGYQAGFSNDKFYKLNHQYVENDLRDLWEYQLDLSRDEIDNIIRHTWELIGKNYTYYFIKDNCALRMSELLGLAIEDPLLADIPWSLPGEVFYHLSKINRHGLPLVKRYQRIPSRQNRFYDGFNQLNNESQSVLVKLVDNALDFNIPEYQSLIPAQQIPIIDTLIDYYEFRIISARSDIELARMKYKLLVERSNLPVRPAVTETNLIAEPKASPPHEGPRPNMLRAGMFSNSLIGSGTVLRSRAVYYDSLETDAGRLENSYLTMMDITAIHQKNNLSLRSIDFVKVQTFNVSRTPLPGDGGIAWKFNLSMENDNLSCTDCRVAKIAGGFGRAKQLTNHVMITAMLDVFSQTNHDDAGTIGIIPNIGFLATYLPYWKTHYTYGNKIFINGGEQKYPVYKWEHRFGSSRYWDIRLDIEKSIAIEHQLSISFYW